MFYPTVSPWGSVSFNTMLSPGFYYVITDIQDGYLLTRDFTVQEDIGEPILSGHLFEDSLFAFPASFDAMQLVLSSRNMAWNIYRNFCCRSNVRLTFYQFFSYARETVFNMFPLLRNYFFDSAKNVEKWVRDINKHVKYLWMEPLHPFSSVGIPIYIPDGWMDATMVGDFQPSIISKDNFFRIYFARAGVPYYLMHSHGSMNITISDYNIFNLIHKAEQQKKLIEQEKPCFLHNRAFHVAVTNY